MRWLGAIAGRLLQFWGVWLLLLGGSCCCFGSAVEDFTGGWRLLRTTLFFSTVALLVVEWIRVNSAMSAVDAELRAVGGRARGGCSAWFVVLFLFASLICWGLFFTLFSGAAHQVASESLLAAVVVIGTLAWAWTLATLWVLLLVQGGARLIRLRRALRRARPGSHPKRPPVLPWTVAAFSSFALFVALGFPSPAFVGTALEIALLVALSQPSQIVSTPSGTGTFDVLVTVAPGSNIRDVDAVSATRASIQPALSGRSVWADPALASTYAVSVPQSDALALIVLLALDTDDVAGVELNSAVEIDPVVSSDTCAIGPVRLPVDDPLATYQGELEEIGGSAALTILAGRRPQRAGVVGVVDTGIDGKHPDLRDVIAPYAISDDLHGHGTAVAGLVAAHTDNGRGVASLNERGAYIRVRSYPALAARRRVATDVAQAIQDATDDSVDVINLSFNGSGEAPWIVRRAVERAQARGAIVVVSAGNGAGDAGERWPANLPGVLVVGATHDGAPARFSKTTYGVAHSVWAPGEGITSLTPGDGYGCGSGTSLAAPMVSGTLAMMRALCPQVSATNAIRIVEASGPVVYGRGITPLGRSLRADTAIAALFQVHPECDVATTGLFRGLDLLVPRTYEAPYYYEPPAPTFRTYDTGD